MDLVQYNLIMTTALKNAKSIKKFDEIRAMRKVKKLSENKQDKAINKNPSKEKSEGSFLER